MRIALIADVHANLRALQAVLTACDAEGIVEFICLGDLAGYGPDPVECVRVLNGRNVRTVRGNHDAAILDPAYLDKLPRTMRETLKFARSVLDVDGLSFLNSTEAPFVVEGKLLCAHGSPDDRDEYVTTAVRMRSIIEGRDTWICAVGHTHQQYVFDGDDGPSRPEGEVSLNSANRYLVNPGSVGQPRDGDPRAAFAILDLEKGTLALRRVDYDAQATAARIYELGLPGVYAERLLRGR